MQAHNKAETPRLLTGSTKNETLTCSQKEHVKCMVHPGYKVAEKLSPKTGSLEMMNCYEQLRLAFSEIDNHVYITSAQWADLRKTSLTEHLPFFVQNSLAPRHTQQYFNTVKLMPLKSEPFAEDHPTSVQLNYAIVHDFAQPDEDSLNLDLFISLKDEAKEF